MERELSFACRRICGGVAEGEVIVSTDPICFYLAAPDTGKIMEKTHALYGQSVAGKILVFPGGKGSSQVQGEGIYQLLKKGTAPKGMIIRYPDTVLVTDAIVMKLPLVDRVEEEFYKQVGNDDRVILDADNGVIKLWRGTSR